MVPYGIWEVRFPQKCRETSPPGKHASRRREKYASHVSRSVWPTVRRDRPTLPPSAPLGERAVATRVSATPPERSSLPCGSLRSVSQCLPHSFAPSRSSCPATERATSGLRPETVPPSNNRRTHSVRRSGLTLPPFASVSRPACRSRSMPVEGAAVPSAAEPNNPAARAGVRWFRESSARPPTKEFRIVARIVIGGGRSPPQVRNRRLQLAP